MTNIKRSLTISQNLRWLRKIHGYTQKRISDMLDIPIGTYGTYENASIGIGKERLKLFCDFWHVSVEHLEMEPEEFQECYLRDGG